MMDFLELAKKRYSVRSFADKQLEPDIMAKILEAGRLAPTAVNYQPQRILIVQDSDGLEKIKQCTKFHFNAPTILIVCYDVTASWKNKKSQEDAGIIDATIVTVFMMLEAAELGAGSVFVGDFDPAPLKKLFNLPDFLHPVALLPLGYPSATAKHHKLHDIRKPLSETVFTSLDGLKSAGVDENQHKSLL